MVITLEDSQIYYVLKSAIHFCNQKNNSCDMEQLDFKLFEFHFGEFEYS